MVRLRSRMTGSGRMPRGNKSRSAPPKSADVWKPPCVTLLWRTSRTLRRSTGNADCVPPEIQLLLEFLYYTDISTIIFNYILQKELISALSLEKTKWYYYKTGNKRIADIVGSNFILMVLLKIFITIVYYFVPVLNLDLYITSMLIVIFGLVIKIVWDTSKHARTVNIWNS